MPHKRKVVICLSSVPVTFLLECVLTRDEKPSGQGVKGREMRVKKELDDQQKVVQSWKWGDMVGEKGEMRKWTIVSGVNPWL